MARKKPPVDKAAQPYYPKNDSQGQLARPAFFMQPQDRYPRGFTPERQAEVGQALKKTKLKGEPLQAARAKETLARSSVPASDLQGLKQINLGADIGKSAGQYVTQRFRKPRINISRDIDQSTTSGGLTLLHELGHHQDKTPPLPSYLSPWGRGADPTLEANAENYADRHYVPDTRVPQKVQHSAYDRLLSKGLANAFDVPWEASTPRREAEKKWAEEYGQSRQFTGAVRKAPPKYEPPENPAEPGTFDWRRNREWIRDRKQDSQANALLHFKGRAMREGRQQAGARATASPRTLRSSSSLQFEQLDLFSD